METISQLIDLIHLEPLERNIFRGENFKTPWGRVFGGQVLAQALHAASQTVPEDRIAHSCHAYFILPGSVELPIIYNVERNRDGRSFTTRRVAGIQNGKTIFIMAVSFQHKEDGFDHQIPMPNVPPPDGLLSDKEWMETIKEKLPELYQRYKFPRPIEFRPVERFDPLSPIPQAPFRNVWMKANGKMDDQIWKHQQALAYASDYNLLSTAFLPHRDKTSLDKVMFASLDHAMWFHRDFRMDDWLLYSLDSPSASNSRGFTRGNIFSRDGGLVASVVQEGLIRELREK